MFLVFLISELRSDSKNSEEKENRISVLLTKWDQKFWLWCAAKTEITLVEISKVKSSGSTGNKEDFRSSDTTGRTWSPSPC